MQAFATHLTPEAKSYEIALPDLQPTSDIENDVRGVVDNIREKLNLDQPIAPSTKRFIESVKNNVGEAVTPAREAVEKATDRGSSDRANSFNRIVFSNIKFLVPLCRDESLCSSNFKPNHGSDNEPGIDCSYWHFRLELRSLGRCALSPPATASQRARSLYPALSNRRS